MRVEVLLAGATAPEPLPAHDLVEADLWDQLPADLPDLLTLVPRADVYLQDEMQVALTVRAAVARSKQRGRVAIVIADNLKTHTAAGSLLVRSLRSRVEGPVVSGVYSCL